MDITRNPGRGFFLAIQVDTVIYIQYNNKMKTYTDGNGLWSDKKANVEITHIEVHEYSEPNDDFDDVEPFGELRAYFDPNEWNVKEDGYIYTDKTWLKSYRQCLLKNGIDELAVADIEYSEKGMQEVNYVSLDIGHVFIAAWVKLTANAV